MPVVKVWAKSVRGPNPKWPPVAILKTRMGHSKITICPRNYYVLYIIWGWSIHFWSHFSIWDSFRHVKVKKSNLADDHPLEKQGWSSQYVCWDQRLLLCMAYTQFQVSKSISDIAFTSEINLKASNSEMQYCHQIVSSVIRPKFLYIHVLCYFRLDNWYFISFYWLRANCLGTNHIIRYFIC